MNSLIYYSGAVVCYAIIAYTALSGFKDSSWYIPVGLIVSLIANLIWMLLVRSLSTNSDIAVAGMVWDGIVIGTIVLMPAILGVPLAAHKWIGLIVATIGIGIALYD